MNVDTRNTENGKYLQIIVCVIVVMYTNTTSTSLSQHESLYCDYIDISLSIQSTNRLRFEQGQDTCVNFRYDVNQTLSQNIARHY